MSAPILSDARELLAMLASEGGIHLVAIVPDGIAQGRSFDSDTEAAIAWAIDQNKLQRGIYWTSNIVAAGMNKKPSKADIAAARVAHVDIDPPKDETAWNKRAAFDEIMAQPLAPSFVIDSGNGLQAVWMMADPTVHKDVIEGVNRKIEDVLGGDACHNIDRLLRVPGFVNWPNKKKREVGRVPVRAGWAMRDDGVRYTPEELKVAFPPIMVKVKTKQDKKPQDSASSPWARLTADQQMKLHRIILSPPGRDRSGDLLAFVRHAIEAGVADDVITAIGTDSRYSISAHALDQADPARAISRAIEKVRSTPRDDIGSGRARQRGNPAMTDHEIESLERMTAEFQGMSPKAGCNGETSEDAIALAFARRHTDRLRFDHSAGRWFEWTGTRWQRNETKLAFHYARELAREASEGKKTFCKASVASGVEAFARADPTLAVTADVWDCDPWLLGAPGGTVNLRSGQLAPSRPSDLITKQTGVEPVRGDPRRWLQFLDEATGGDSALMRFLQQVAGYCLTGLTNEHALFFIYGPGGNGKSVFLNLLNFVLGDYATTAAMETFTASKHDKHPTDLAMLNGARLVSASETEEGRAWAESRIKQVTGGDKISARFMRQDFFEFIPQFKLVIVGNHAPVLGNVDEAARRRFNIIPFTQKPVTPDRELEDKLKAEAGQILSWAIAGCIDWQTNGLVRPEIVTAATADYFEDQDLFSQWLEDNCERDPVKWELPTPLYNDWAAYARAAGDDPGNSRSMKGKLVRAGFPQKKTNGLRVYRGLVLKRPVPNYD